MQVGIDIFFREAQLVWDEVYPFIDKRASDNLSRLWYEGAAILDDPRLELVKDGRAAVLHNPEAHFLDTGALRMPTNPDDPVWAAAVGEIERLQDAAAPRAVALGLVTNPELRLPNRVGKTWLAGTNCEMMGPAPPLVTWEY